MSGGELQVSRAEMEAAAVRLRNQGADYRTIAATLDCSVSSAHRMVTRTLARLPVEDVDTMRRLEAGRLEAIHQALWPKVLDGDQQAAAVCVRASAARSRLYGLAVPVPVQLAGAESITVMFHSALMPNPPERLDLAELDET